MNPDTPHNSREELEAGLTALLLGELPPEQAAELRRAIEQDAALAALYQRLKLTIDLVRETAVQPAQQTAAQPPPLKLSEGRRQELLAHFKTLAPKEFARPRRQQWRLPVLAAAAAMLAGLLALGLFLPALSASKRKPLAWASGSTPGGSYYGGAAYGGYSTATPLPLESGGSVVFKNVPGIGAVPMMREAPAARVPAEAGTAPGKPLAPAPTAAPLPALAQPQPAPSRAVEGESVVSGPVVSPPAQVPAVQGEGGGAPPPPARANRTAIVLPGSAAANETAAQTEAPFTLAGTPPSGGGGGGPVVRTFNLSHADPKQLAEQLSKLFPDTSRTDTGPGFGFRFGGGGPFGGGFPGNVHVASNTRDNRTSQVIAVPQPGTNSVAVSADGQLMPHIAEMIDKLDVDASQEAIKVYDLANADPQDAKQILQDLFQRSGNIRADDNNNRKAILGAGGAVRMTQNQPPPGLGNDLAGSSGGGGMPAGRGGFPTVPHVTIPPGGGMAGGMGPMGGGMVGSMYGVTPPEARVAGIPVAESAQGKKALGQVAATNVNAMGQPVMSFGAVDQLAAAAPPQDQIPIFGDKPVTRLGWLNESTASADAGRDLKVKDLPVELLLADSKAEGLPAQAPTATAPQGNKAAEEAPEAAKRYRRLIPGPPQEPAQNRDSSGISDVYFSIDPESRAVFTAANSGTNLAASQAASSVYRQGVTNIEQGLAGNGIAARYAYVVPSVTNAVRKLEELERKGTTLEPRLREGLAGLGVEQQRLAQAQQDANQSYRAARKQPAAPAPIPQPEVQTRENAFSTFSLNVSDVSFKLAAASLEKGMMPEPAAVRSEEFINAFDYRDPEAPAGVPVAFACERARYPFAQNRDLLRFSLKTAAGGRQAGRALNVVLLLDTSGSMERADRVRIIHEALRVLAGQLDAQDTLSVVTFARTARLWVDGVPGSQAGRVAEEVSGLTPEGGTNLEEAMNLAYQTALRHYLANGINRVVLLTDGAANLGNVEPEALKQKVEAHRKQGVALDCFGIGWEGYNDDLLEVLSRNGDGRYGFLNTPEEAATGFAGQLAGALRVAASDVKVQVEFNPARVRAYRQLGYARHQLAKEQFRDNTVVAAQIGAAESGNALYVIETDPRGDGPLGVVRVRYRLPGTSDYREQEWTAPYTGSAAPLERASAALRLAAVAGAFSEWLASSPFAGEVTPERLLGCLRGVPEVYGPDARPRKLEWMIRQAQSLGGK